MEFYVYFCEPVPTEDIKEHLFCVLRILMSWFQKRSVDVRYYLMGVMGSRDLQAPTIRYKVKLIHCVHIAHT